MKIFVLGFGAVNVISVFLTCLDKSSARKKGARRIPESRLFAAALLGGALGMYITMRLIRHKTLHKRFMIGLPVIIAVQIFFAWVCWASFG